MGGEDSSRADLDFLLTAVEAAARVGAHRYRFADTLGVMEDVGRSVFLKQHIGGFDQHFDLVADLKAQMIHTTAGDDTFNQVIANPDGDVCHDLAHEYFFDVAGELVSCGDCHSALVYPRHAEAQHPIGVTDALCIGSLPSPVPPAILCHTFYINLKRRTYIHSKDEAMTDNVQHGPSDLDDINPKIASDIQYWSKELGVTGDVLHETIRVHGTHIKKIRAALAKPTAVTS